MSVWGMCRISPLLCGPYRSRHRHGRLLTTHESDFFIYHDALSAWWEKEAQEHMASLGYADRQVRCIGDTNADFARYKGCLVGDSPELMPLSGADFSEMLPTADFVAGAARSRLRDAEVRVHGDSETFVQLAHGHAVSHVELCLRQFGSVAHLRCYRPLGRRGSVRGWYGRRRRTRGLPASLLLCRREVRLAPAASGPARRRAADSAGACGRRVAGRSCSTGASWCTSGDHNPEMGALDDGYPSQARSGGGRRPAGAHWGSLRHVT